MKKPAEKKEKPKPEPKKAPGWKWREQRDNWYRKNQ